MRLPKMRRKPFSTSGQVAQPSRARRLPKKFCAAAATERAKDRLQGQIADKERIGATLEESLRQQQERIEQLKQAAADPKSRQEVEKMVRSLGPVQKRLASATTELEKMRRQLAEETRKVAADTAGKAAAALQKVPDQLQTTQAAALEAQQNARVLQSEAVTAVSAPASPPPAAEAMPVAETNSTPSLDGKSFSELFTVAVETEKSIAERYQAIRAAQVAVQNQIPLAEAQKYVQVALPIRSELPPEASATEVKDAAALAAQNAAMEKALKELESMLSLTRGMAAQARRTSTGSEGVTISAEAMKAQAAQKQQLAAMAMEVEGQPAVDLTEMMKSIEAGSPGGAKGTATAGQGEGGAADGQGAGSGKPGGTGSGGAFVRLRAGGAGISRRRGGVGFRSRAQGSRRGLRSRREVDVHRHVVGHRAVSPSPAAKPRDPVPPGIGDRSRCKLSGRGRGGKLAVRAEFLRHGAAAARSKLRDFLRLHRIVV